MDYTIISINQDVSGKFCTRVIIDNNTQETMFFYFDNYPSQEEVNNVVNNYLTSLNNENSTNMQ